MEITINLRGLDVLANALVQLASAMGVNSTPTVTQQPLAAFVPPPSVSVAPPPPPAPTAPPPVSVPTTVAPTYTHAQISLAGSPLMDSGKGDALIALLSSFGVIGIPQLKQEQLGAFATEMRKLGAQI